MRKKKGSFSFVGSQIIILWKYKNDDGVIDDFSTFVGIINGAIGAPLLLEDESSRRQQ